MITSKWNWKSLVGVGKNKECFSRTADSFVKTATPVTGRSHFHPWKRPRVRHLTLEQLREKKKPGSTVPNNFVFSSKGTITYESLDLPDFINGFLEFQKEKPDACTSSLTKHLQLLMARASTYNWSSVRSFHLLNRLPWQSTKADFRGLTVTRFVRDHKVNIFHASRLTNAPTHIGHATKSTHAAVTVTKIQPWQEGEILP